MAQTHKRRPAAGGTAAGSFAGVAGMKSLQTWRGDSVPVRSVPDAVDLACLIGDPSPASDQAGFFSAGHHSHVARFYPDHYRLLGSRKLVFVDSITDLTPQATAWAKTRPEAFSGKTDKLDARGIYGLLACEVIGMLKLLQHAPDRTVIFVGILDPHGRRDAARELAAAARGRKGRSGATRLRRPSDDPVADRPRQRWLPAQRGWRP
jgi:hypothetical protein